MPVITACDVCNHRKKIPDSKLGDEMICSVCSSKFIAEEAPEVDEEERDPNEPSEFWKTLQLAWHGVLAEMCDDMKEYMYPFDQADAVTTLQQYVIPVLPEEQNVMGLVYVTQDSCERLTGIQSRLFAKLAHAAEKVEAAVGLPPLKERKKKDEKK